MNCQNFRLRAILRMKIAICNISEVLMATSDIEAPEYRDFIILRVHWTHCKWRAGENINIWFRFMCWQKWNYTRPGYFQNRIVMFRLPISTFMYLWAIYIFQGSVSLFCFSQIGRPILGIYKLFTDTWIYNWEWGHTVSYLGIPKSDFWYSAYVPYKGSAIYSHSHLQAHTIKNFMKKVSSALLCFRVNEMAHVKSRNTGI
jgi:hypothetical protein